jgi:hypothetical protein
MFQELLISIGLVAFSIPSPFAPWGMSQRPLRQVPSRELVNRLYIADLAQEAQHEIRERMNEVAIKGVDEDRELVETLLETLDGQNVKVKGEAVINLFIVQDKSVRKRLLQLLSQEGDGATQAAVLGGISLSQGVWPVEDRDIENIKSIILRPIQSIDDPLKGRAILALGALGAVTALEELQKHEGIRQAFGDSLDAALTRAKKVKKDNPDQ